MSIRKVASQDSALIDYYIAKNVYVRLSQSLIHDVTFLVNKTYRAIILYTSLVD